MRRWLALALAATLAFAAPGCWLFPRLSDTDDEHFANFDGTQVFYRDAGKESPVLVLVHGWLCDHTVWTTQVEGLRGKARLLVVDLPGHGGSDKPEDADYSMDYLARSLAAVMDDAGVDRAVLVGHSNGTPVIRQFYRLFPQRTEALVIVDGALKPWTTDTAMMERIVDTYRGDDYREQINLWIEKSEHSALLKEIVARPPQYVVVRTLEGAMDPAIWTDDTIDVPVLAIMAASPFWTAEYETSARQLAPHMDYRVMTDVSHFLMMEEPARVNAAILEFLYANRIH